MQPTKPRPKNYLQSATNPRILNNLIKSRASMLSICDGKDDKALLLSHLAILQFKQGQKPDALITISEAVTIAPKNPAVIINLGHLRIRQGLFLEALEAFDLASQLGAIREPAVYLNRSIALRGLGRYLEARENYVQYRLLIEQTDQRKP